MSQDIRSFFQITGKKKEGVQKQDPSPVKKRNSNRKRVIIESDSDDDLSPPKKITKKASTNNKIKEESPTKSKYFATTAQNVFGTEKIQRIPPKKLIKKVPDPGIVGMLSDNEFDSMLVQMDDIDPDDWEKQPNETKSSDDILKNNESTKPNVEICTISGYASKKFLHEISPKKEKSSVESVKSTVHNISPEQSPVKISKKSTMDIDKTNSIQNILFENVSHKTLYSKEIKGIKDINNLEIDKKIQVCNKEEETYQKNLSQEIKSKLNENFVSKISSKRKDNFGKIFEEKGRIIVENDNFNKSTNRTQEKIEESDLWVDKYRPKSLKQIVGQQGDKSNVKKLLSWLQNWYKNHSGNKKLSKPNPWAKDDNGAYFKAALLSGPPGIGKTTTAHLVCKELGFDVVEFNASDTRSKKMLHQEISELLSTKSLTPYFTGGGTKGGEVTKKHALVMDEVDGMAGNEDRGGVQELIQLVKTTRIPIICMCNDRNHPKIRSLANYCYDLRFQRPTAKQISGAMMSVCCKEKLKIAPNTLADIITCSNQDIRLVLNHLSMVAAQNSSLGTSKKHIKLGPWDVARLVFSETEHKTMSIHDKCDLFFHDYSIGPLFVQENYLNVSPHSENAKNKRKKMELFAKAAHSISLGDVTDKVIRSQNAWSLLPTQAIFSSLVPGQVLEGHVAGQINFPSWLGKNSRRGKLDRLVQEIQVHTRLRASGSKESINLDYAVPLRDLIIRPLLQGSEGVSQALTSLQEYNLVKDDFDNLCEICLWPNSKDPMAKVESKVKAAFTRAYNKSGMLPPYATSSVVKKGKGGFEMEDELENEEDEAEDESIEVDAMITVKKPTKKSAVESSPSTSKGKGGAGKNFKKSKTSKK